MNSIYILNLNRTIYGVIRYGEELNPDHEYMIVYHMCMFSVYG